MPTDTPILTLAHSPDPDDAFMWWPLGDVESGRDPAIDTAGFRFRTVAADIEALNNRAVEQGDLDFTAVSAHTYPHIKDRYAVTSCGASFGDGYGPRVIARPDRMHPGTDWLIEEDALIAVPGTRTTAFLTLRLLLGRDFRHAVIPFEKIPAAVAERKVDAGLVIHEAQLTFTDLGLELVADVGTWWTDQTGLPLPLGLNVARRNLDDRFGAGAAGRLTAVLGYSIRHAMDQREASMAHAMRFAQPGAPADRADEFVRMYVNERTLDLGDRGAEALRRLLGEGRRAGLCPDPGEVDILRPISEGD